MAIPPANSEKLVYQVSFQLKLAELRYGRVVHTYPALGSRRFLTAEPNVILAELYEELRPAYNLLGLEILHIRCLRQRATPPPCPAPPLPPYPKGNTRQALARELGAVRA